MAGRFEFEPAPGGLTMFVYNIDVPPGESRVLEARLTREEVADMIWLMCKSAGLARPWVQSGL